MHFPAAPIPPAGPTGTTLRLDYRRIHRLDNLTLLCRYHHTHFLQKGWTCQINADGLPEWIPPWWIDQHQRPQLNARIRRLHAQQQLSRRRRVPDSRMTTQSAPSVERHIEIACDESGFSGGNLVGGGHSPVFAHASVRIELEAARELVQHLRREIGARGDGEYKSPEILRPRRRPIVLWAAWPQQSHPPQRTRSPHGHPILRPCPPDRRAPQRARCARDRLSRTESSHPTDGARPLRSVSKAMGPLDGRSSSLCRPISSGSTTGGCRSTGSRCSTRRSRRWPRQAWRATSSR